MHFSEVFLNILLFPDNVEMGDIVYFTTIVNERKFLEFVLEIKKCMKIYCLKDFNLAEYYLE